VEEEEEEAAAWGRTLRASNGAELLQRCWGSGAVRRGALFIICAAHCPF
jgi:hypothetical protein